MWPLQHIHKWTDLSPTPIQTEFQHSRVTVPELQMEPVNESFQWNNSKACEKCLGNDS